MLKCSLLNTLLLLRLSTLRLLHLLSALLLLLGSSRIP
jgi:hypothetical protein